MSLTVRLGCDACYAHAVIDLPVRQRWEDGAWHLCVDTSLICAWRGAHLQPTASTQP